MKNNLSKTVVAIFVFFTLLPITATAQTSGGISIKDAWIREAPPNAPVLAAYLTIENHTDKANALISIISSSFELVEIHTSYEEDGMAKMKQIEKLEIKAEGKAVLEPGGFHLMLIKPKKVFKAGDTISMIFNFADGTKSNTSLTVKKVIGSPGHMHHGSHNGEHSEGHQKENHNEHKDGHHREHKNDEHSSHHSEKLEMKEQHHSH